MRRYQFEWDDQKNESNRLKHKVSFKEAQKAFLDPDRVLAEDLEHSNEKEKRFYCFGKVKEGVLTVRFTLRKDHIRIIGAGYWRKGKKIYEEERT